jgi:hypothetical protein
LALIISLLEKEVDNEETRTAPAGAKIKKRNKNFSIVKLYLLFFGLCFHHYFGKGLPAGHSPS